MEIEVKVTGRKDVQAQDRETVTVETHRLRGDTYVVFKADQVLENSSTVFKVSGGDRLVITSPMGGDEIVYDREQGAAVKKSSLEPTPEAEKVAGAVPGSRPQFVQSPADKAAAEKKAREDAQARQIAENKAKAAVDAAHKAANDQKLKDQAAADAKAKEAEAAKAQQESGAGRPPGESPPQPGSPVGSPPSGNEGTNKGS